MWGQGDVELKEDASFYFVIFLYFDECTRTKATLERKKEERENYDSRKASIVILFHDVKIKHELFSLRGKPALIYQAIRANSSSSTTSSTETLPSRREE